MRNHYHLLLRQLKNDGVVKISNGKFESLDQGKIDISVYGSEKDLINALNSNNKNIKDNISNLNVKGESLKGKIAVIIAEKFAKIKLNKNKSFSDKFVGAIIYPITGFFIKN